MPDLSFRRVLLVLTSANGQRWDRVPTTEHGTFFSDNVYLVLTITNTTRGGLRLRPRIWRGLTSSLLCTPVCYFGLVEQLKQRLKAAHYLRVKWSRTSIIQQGSETHSFVSLFGRSSSSGSSSPRSVAQPMRILKGKPASLGAANHLYIVTHVAHHDAVAPLLVEVPNISKSLNAKGLLVLETPKHGSVCFVGALYQPPVSQFVQNLGCDVTWKEADRLPAPTPLMLNFHNARASELHFPFQLDYWSQFSSLLQLFEFTYTPPSTTISVEACPTLDLKLDDRSVFLIHVSGC